MEIKTLASGKTGVFGASQEEISELRTAFIAAQLGTITRKSGETVQALIIPDALTTVRGWVEWRQPLMLDWHNEAAVEAFSRNHLNPCQAEYVERLLPQLTWEEQGKGKASPSSHRLADKLAEGAKMADVVKWINEQSK